MLQDVGVDHRGGNIAVAQELLDGSNVVATFQEVRDEGVAEGVAGDALSMPAAAAARTTVRCDGLLKYQTAELRKALCLFGGRRQIA